MNNAPEALIGAVVAFGRGIAVDDPIVRKPVAKALGLKRLRTTRFSAVLEEALGTERIQLIENKLYPIEDIKTPDTTVKKTSPKPPSRASKPKQYMGLLLESRLNTLSKDIPEGRATATFCHCPNCGTPLILEGVVRVAND